MPQGPVDLGTCTTEESFSTPRNRTLAVKQHGLEKCIALLGNKKRISRRISFLITRERAGCHKVQWTLALARPRGALASREIEPKLQSSWVSRSAPHFSDNKKGLPIRKSFLLSKRERAGCHKVQWTLALARPRSALALREIEPLLQSSMRSRSASHF